MIWLPESPPVLVEVLNEPLWSRSAPRRGIGGRDVVFRRAIFDPAVHRAGASGEGFVAPFVPLVSPGTPSGV